MKDYGLVSIITASYNSAEWIGKTIESVIAQSYPNWELLITDDGSHDSTVEVVNSYIEKDSRIKLFRLNENQGAGVARNNSISKSSGKYLAFLDSDDMWIPDKLERQLQFMERKGALISHGTYMLCNEEGHVYGLVISRSKESLISMYMDDMMGMLTVMYDASKLGKIYMPTLRKRQDYGMKLLLLKKGAYSYGMKEPLGYYRRRSESISNRKLKLIKYNIAVYSEALGWSRLRSLLHFGFVYVPHHIGKMIIGKIVNK